MIHVWSNHIENCSFPAFTLDSFDSHLFQLQHIVVTEHLEELDFAESCDRKPILFIMH